MKKLLLRGATGAVYVALIVGAILGGLPWFTALMSLFTVLAVLEFTKVVNGGLQTHGTAPLSTAVDVLAALAIVNLVNLFNFPSWLSMTAVTAAAVYLPLRFTIAIYDKRPEAFRCAAWSVLALAYIAVPLCMVCMLYADRSSAPMLVLAMFVMIWLNDTGAYLVGSAIGRHKLFERLSPKKSWEGFFGGLVFDIAAGAACHWLIPGVPFGLAGWIGFGIMVCLLSTWGDLFESLMKRSMHIKDSGNIIPGHGGILDRIDSLLFVAIGSFVYYNFFF